MTVLAVLCSIQCVSYVVIIPIHWSSWVLFPDKTKHVCVGVCVWWYSHVFMCVRTPVHADVDTYVYVCMYRPEVNIRCLQKLFSTLFFEWRSHWIWNSRDSPFSTVPGPRLQISITEPRFFTWVLGNFNPGPHVWVANSLPTEPYLENSKILRTKFNSRIWVPMALIFS